MEFWRHQIENYWCPCNINFLFHLDDQNPEILINYFNYFHSHWGGVYLLPHKLCHEEASARFCPHVNRQQAPKRHQNGLKTNQ